MTPYDARLGIQSGGLPRHQYVWLDPEAVLVKPDGQTPLQAVWFGLQSIYGRLWGCHCLLECGAMFRNVPLHQLRHRPDAVAEWSPSGRRAKRKSGTVTASDFPTLIYPYLDGLDCQARIGHDKTWLPASYRFNAVPIGDAYTQQPEQAKEFIFVALDNGRFTTQPSNRILFTDKSFTTGELPSGGLRLQTEIWHAE